jgi:hypothetical protein
MRVVLLLASALLLSGCLAKTAFDIATLPVRAVAAGVDAVTTTSEERDRANGRRLREEDERRGREAREAEQRAREQARREGNRSEPD